ncbi:MAG: hypothetical protein ACYC8T_17500 [Myxococcaceae bacterium]
MWANFYEAGGWGMYPTSLFGFLLLASAMLIALRPEQRFVPAALCLGAMTMASGVLGCTMGLVRTFSWIHKVPAAEQLPIMAAGSAESLNNLVLALIVVLVSLLVALVGAVRAARVGAVAPVAVAA